MSAREKTPSDSAAVPRAQSRETLKQRLQPLSPQVPLSALDGTSNQSALMASPPVNPDLVRATEVAGAKKVGKNTLEILSFRVLTTFVSLAIVVVQSRFLEPSGRGIFVLAVLSVSVFSRLLGQLGVAVTNRMGLPEYDTATEVEPLVQRAMVIGSGLGILGGALIVAWGASTPSVGPWTALAAAAALVPNVITQTLSGVLLGLARIRIWNYIQLMSPTLAFVGVSIAVIGFHGGVTWALVAWTLSQTVAAAFALWKTQDVWRPLQFRPLFDPAARLLVRLALTMGAMQVIALIGYRIELFILQALRGVAAVGLYSIAMQATESIWLITAAVATAVTAPVVRSREAEAQKLIEDGIKKSLLYTVAAATVVALAAHFIIPLALGHAFAAAVHPLWLIMPGVVLYAPVQVLVIYVSVRRGRPRLSLAAAAVAMAMTAILAFPLISLFGTSGAAVSSSLGYASGVLLLYYFFKRLANHPTALQVAKEADASVIAAAGA